MIQEIDPRLPFIWPEPRVSNESAAYPTEPPLKSAMQSSASIFGVVSAIDSRAIDWMRDYLNFRADNKLRIVASVYPTSRTSIADLKALLKLMKSNLGRAEFRIYPECDFDDRASNILGLIDSNGNITISNGPTENLGYSTRTPTHANLVADATPLVLEQFRNWFNYLWGVAGVITSQLVNAFPELIIPKGDAQADRDWNSYRRRCLSSKEKPSSTQPMVDPKSGDVELVDLDGNRLATPSADLGIEKLDLLIEYIARLYDQGALVTIVKEDRVPPFQAPIKPEWFDVDREHIEGSISSKIILKVSPFDNNLRKEMGKLRRISVPVLNEHSLPLSDGLRWLPRKVIPILESELTKRSDDAQLQLRLIVGDDVGAFLESQRPRITADAQRMYANFHPDGVMPEKAMLNIMTDLRARLTKASGSKLIPKLIYTRLSFNPLQVTQWSSPWSQALDLLMSIAKFPRAIICKGLRTDVIPPEQTSLFNAMNIAEDCAYEDPYDYPSWRATEELSLIKQLEDVSCEHQKKCEALWILITTGKQERIKELLAYWS